MANDPNILQTIQLKHDADVIAPDGSAIRLLPATARGSLCHCTLQVGQVSSAIRHRQVEEIWYVLDGHGEVWRKGETDEVTVSLVSGTSLTIPPRYSFQFRNTGFEPLRILIVTMPPWPGPDEAEPVIGSFQG